MPVVFKDEKNPFKSVSIIDIEVNHNSMIALSNEHKIYVWGRRMGIYPQLELTLANVEGGKGMQYEYHEINQACPRLLKNNLVFYKPCKILSGHFNVALITSDGELMVQGSNTCNQMLLSPEIEDHVQFFPDFLKLDFFNPYIVEDVAFSEYVMYVLCQHKETFETHLFGWGVNTFGQLGVKDLEFCIKEPKDMTSMFPGMIKQVKCGAYHTMVLTEQGKLYGIGKVSRGQLALKQQEKQIYEPVEILIPDSISEIACGSFCSFALTDNK